MVKQHNSKAVKKIFRKLETQGFVIVKKRSGSYRIDPPDTVDNKDSYYTHGTESSIHQMRRDFKKKYNTSLE